MERVLILVLAVMVYAFIAAFFLKPISVVYADEGGQYGWVSYNDFKKRNINSEAVLKAKLGIEMDNVVIKICDMKGMIPEFVRDIPTKGMSDGKYSDGGLESEAYAAMLYNTWLLQYNVSCAKESDNKTVNGKVLVGLPEGVYYFRSGHIEMLEGSGRTVLGTVRGSSERKVSGQHYERHVIRPENNVWIRGKGNDDHDKSAMTALKPYSERKEFTNNTRLRELRLKYDSELTGSDFQYTQSGQGGKIGGGLDMFFFNDYKALNFPSNVGDELYLQNVNFTDFIIDSGSTRGDTYETSGKGFMINVFKNCLWERVTVRNTDGTGFGVDSPDSSVIRNCLAERNGKNAKFDELQDGEEYNHGASGFGIGTGYSDNEDMLIEDSVSKNNAKYGFFFEHQDRWGDVGARAYEATRGDFRVRNSKAIGNLYNFGGERAYYTSFENIEGKKGETVRNMKTKLDINFTDQSRTVSMENVKLNDEIVFSDVTKDKYYYDAVKWAAMNNITHGVKEDVDKNGKEEAGRFAPDNAINRGDTVLMLWRWKGNPGGEGVTGESGTLALSNGNITNNSVPNIETCFDDVSPDVYYAGAILWASNKKIVNGKTACTGDSGGKFDPEESLTRGEAVVILYRFWHNIDNRVGSKVDSGKTASIFTDLDHPKYQYDDFQKAVGWAVKNGITNGVSETEFAPDNECTKGQWVTFIYRYSQAFGK